jgi:hypothetical protein
LLSQAETQIKASTRADGSSSIDTGMTARVLHNQLKRPQDGQHAIEKSIQSNLYIAVGIVTMDLKSYQINFLCLKRGDVFF